MEGSVRKRVSLFEGQSNLSLQQSLLDSIGTIQLALQGKNTDAINKARDAANQLCHNLTVKSKQADEADSRIVDLERKVSIQEEELKLVLAKLRTYEEHESMKTAYEVEHARVIQLTAEKKELFSLINSKDAELGSFKSWIFETLDEIQDENMGLQSAMKSLEAQSIAAKAGSATLKSEIVALNTSLSLCRLENELLKEREAREAREDRGGQHHSQAPSSPTSSEDPAHASESAVIEVVDVDIEVASIEELRRRLLVSERNVRALQKSAADNEKRFELLEADLVISIVMTIEEHVGTMARYLEMESKWDSLVECIYTSEADLELANNRIKIYDREEKEMKKKIKELKELNESLNCCMEAYDSERSRLLGRVEELENEKIRLQFYLEQAEGDVVTLKEYVTTLRRVESIAREVKRR